MPITQKNNIPFDQGVHALKEFIAAQGQSDDQIRLRYVNVRKEDAWVTLVAVAHLCPHEASEDLLYSGLGLHERWSPVDQFLIDLANGTIRVGTDQDMLKGGMWEQSSLPSDNEYWGHPGMLFSVSLQQVHAAEPNGPLLDYDKPYYPDASDAVREWLSVNNWHGFSDGRRGHLLVLIPEHRAYFSSIKRVSDTEIAIGITRTTDGLLKIKGAWSINGASTPVDIEAGQEAVAIDVPIDAGRVELFLIGQDNTVHDYHKESALGFVEHDTRILGGSAITEADQDLLKT